MPPAIGRFFVLSLTTRNAAWSRACFGVNYTMTGPRRSSRLGSQTATKESTQTASSLPLAAAAAAVPGQSKRKRNATSGASPNPATPTKRRARRPVTPSSPPRTPTTGVAAVVLEPATGAAGNGPPTARRKGVARLADPRLSNATLVSPETSRVVASRDVDSVSPSKIHAVTTTTQNLLDEACEHLISVDERLRPLIEKNPCKLFSPEGLAEKIDPFESLASGIVSQQVSGAAAKSIKAKFVGLFDREGPAPRFPHPSEVVQCSMEKLRSAGLSQRKAEYIQGLAEKFTSGDLSAKMLHDAPYEELVEKLVAVRGLGRWSVEMFAFFGLKRMDVFSTGDLGVQRGMAAFAGRDVAKLKSKGGKWKYMSERDMLDTSAKFAPYRSLFMWLMWKVENSYTDVSTME
ncbi:hypothetical protein HIM_04399 [Hirsutella minnesotensis 3608]|uniref:HhH-GPD domain-containing protein n=1 Tax=Hirsutella minnesotensis 3608 TaxID=1043627 RepID=A0A0F8A1L7_9HYPO|nr:hypothetical protein HIM_04399 [Hirsutella minnesotensis 3608]